MVDEDDVPDWVLGDARFAVSAIDTTTRQLAFVARQANLDLTFGRIPSRWRITVETGYGPASVSVELEHQYSRVSWQFVLGQHSTLVLPANLTAVQVTNLAANAVTTIEWARATGKLTLSDGEYNIAIGENGDGLLRIERALDERATSSALAVSGSARVEHVTGPGRTLTKLHTVAPKVGIRGDDNPLTILGSCVDLEINGCSQVSLDGEISGTLRAACDSFIAPTLNASGQVLSRVIHVNGAVTPRVGRLALVSAGEIWCGSGVTSTDFTLEPDSPVKPTLILGTNSPIERLTVATGPMVPLSHLEPARISIDGRTPKDYPSVHNPWPQFYNCTISGTGDVEAAGHFHSSVVEIDGTLVCAGSFRAGELPSDRVWIKAVDVFVDQFIDLAGGEARVANRLHSSGLSAATLTVGTEELVVAAHQIRSSTVTARVLTISPTDESAGRVDDSSLTVREHLYVSGQVEGLSKLTAHGEGGLHGTFGPATDIRWDLRSELDHENAPTFALSGKITGVLTTLSGTTGARPLLTMDGEAGFRELYVTGDLAIRAELGTPPDSVGRVVLEDGADVVLEGAVPDFPQLTVKGTADLKIVGTAETRVVSLGLSAGTPSANVRLDASRGEVRLVATRDDKPGAEAPLLEVVRGTLDINTSVPKVTCMSRRSEFVVIDVGEKGRVHQVVGKFALRDLSGRLQGAPSTKDSEMARLQSWPAGSTNDNSGARGVGQLIDVDVTSLPPGDVASLARVHVLSPLGRPLMDHARSLGPWGNGKLRAYRQVLHKPHSPASDDNIRAEAQRLKEMADIVRTRSNSGDTYSAAQWAAAHAHALHVKWFSFERMLRFMHRWVGYGVRPGPALATYAGWTLLVALSLFFWDSDPGTLVSSPDFRPGTYGFLDSLGRAFLLPAGVLRSDVGGATPYRPAFESPVWHFVLVIATGVVVGFLAVALKNFLLRPRSDA